MTKQVDKFPITFIPANRGVQSCVRIDGCRAFPHDKDTQPKPFETFMCSEGFRLKDKPVMILNVHEQLETSPEDMVRASAAAEAQAKPRSNNQGGKRHHGDRHDKKSGDNRGEGKPRHDGNKNRRGKSEGQSWRKFATASGPNREAKKQPATAADSFARAKALLNYKPSGEVKFGNLGEAWMHQRAQGDKTAVSIRTGMSRMVARIEQLGEKMVDPMSIVGA